MVTTAGALLTILFGLISLMTRDRVDIPHDARPWLYVSLSSFVIAVAFGLAANRPSRYLAATTAGLSSVIRDSHRHTAFGAHVRVAKTQLRVLQAYSKANRRKSMSVTAGIAAVFVAVLSLAVVVAHLIAAN